MAKLVEVGRPGEIARTPFHLPITVESNLVKNSTEAPIMMTAQFTDDCMTCDFTLGRQTPSYSEFCSKYDSLTEDELISALTISQKEILGDILTQSVPCVGCRRCVEAQLGLILEWGHATLDPLYASPEQKLTLKKEIYADCKKLYRLFQVHAGKLNAMVESFPKSRKNGRCAIHTLEMHKTKSMGFVQSFLTGVWPEVWYSMNKECKEEVTIIDFSNLSEALDDYLHKHRFCSECKNKVLRAYRLLIKEETINPPATTNNGESSSTTGATDKGSCYNPALYAKLSVCTADMHIHVECSESFVRSLITRAEPEIKGSGNGRERHAKTLDVAQEEVLTCIGVLLYDRLYVIWQKLKTEEQAWLILYHLSIDVLLQGFELAIEKKCGISRLERTCLELIDSEQLKVQRKQLKRERRKKNRAAAAAAVQESNGCTESNGAESSCKQQSTDSCAKPGTVAQQSDDDEFSTESCRMKRSNGGHGSARGHTCGGGGQVSAPGLHSSASNDQQCHKSAPGGQKGQTSRSGGLSSACGGQVSAVGDKKGHASAICEADKVKCNKSNKKKTQKDNRSSSNDNNNSKGIVIGEQQQQQCDCLTLSTSSNSSSSSGTSSGKNSCSDSGIGNGSCNIGGSKSKENSNNNYCSREDTVHCRGTGAYGTAPNGAVCNSISACGTAQNGTMHCTTTNSTVQNGAVLEEDDDLSCSCTDGAGTDKLHGEGASVPCRGDCGYSSGIDGCDVLSAHSSNDGSSDTLCSEACCSNDGQSGCKECCDVSGRQRRHYSPLFGLSALTADSLSGGHRFSSALSLADMLEDDPREDGELDNEEPGISEEEIALFRSNRKILETQRNQLRQRLRQDFDRMRQQRGGLSGFIVQQP